MINIIQCERAGRAKAANDGAAVAGTPETNMFLKAGVEAE